MATAIQVSIPERLVSALVVDDEMPVAESFKEILEHSGCGVDIALSPEEGQERLANKDYQLIVSDQIFEQAATKGEDFVLKNKELMPKTRMVLITGQGMDKIRNRHQLSAEGVPILIKGDATTANDLTRIAKEKLEEQKKLLSSTITSAIPLLEKAEQVLVNWLKNKSEPHKQGIFYGGHAYSPNDLIQEIAQRTEVGKAYIEMFFDLIQDRLGI